MKIVGYLRVSTGKQGESGLGLEGQLAAIKQYAAATDGVVIHHYTEVESGTISNRSELSRALAHARRAKATLVVAKLDRLARNVAFTSQLMDSGVDFICCDNPHANRLTMHILAAVAEDESRRISERTKSALKAAKARGVKLGSSRPGHWDGREEKRLEGLVKAREVSVSARRAQAIDAYRDIRELLQELRKAGQSFRSIAAHLNAEGYTTRRDKSWTAAQVSRALKLLKLESTADSKYEVN
jgi:DNA invertase Pin-like site-specific DNA recombinase